jgi:predicted MFS family arabinose efflux permease
MAPDFGATARVVGIVNGIGGGLAGAAGSLVGGYLADRMSRRLAYAVAGGLTALSALAMLLAPLSQTTYAWGTLAYTFANGIAFATWAGLVLELIGHTAATTTKYALFNASSNLAISYVTWLDGWAASGWLFPAGLRGSRGSLAMDVTLTLAGIAALLVMVAVVRRRAGPSPAASAADVGG